MSELLIGCGNSRRKPLKFEGSTDVWNDLTTLDIDPDCKPDVLHDLTVCPYPFADNQFDEIHAYEVLEHCGKQGDWRLFFRQFDEFWRILKPNGLFIATVPMWDSVWAWGDPGHSRVITRETLIFLNQQEYELQIGKTSMTDYRSVYKGNFHSCGVVEVEVSLGFALKAIK